MLECAGLGEHSVEKKKKKRNVPIHQARSESSSLGQIQDLRPQWQGPIYSDSEYLQRSRIAALIEARPGRKALVSKKHRDTHPILTPRSIFSTHSLQSRTREAHQNRTHVLVRRVARAWHTGGCNWGLGKAEKGSGQGWAGHGSGTDIRTKRSNPSRHGERRKQRQMSRRWNEARDR